MTQALEEPEIVEQEPTLRESIEAAVEEHEEPIAPDTPAPAKVEPPDTSTPTPQQAPAPTSDRVQTAPPKAQVPGQPSATPTPGQPAAAEEPLKAPSQWKATVRDKWAALPREVQEEVIRREGDMMRTIGSVGHKVAFANEVSQHFEPFVQRLQENGVSPGQFMGEVFGSIRTLATGTPGERADVVANIIRAYNVDVNTLDAALTRMIQTPAEVHQARQVTERAQRVISHVEARREQEQNQQRANEANQALTTFAADPKHEFFEDVRDVMADLIQSGHCKDLESAYQAAIWATPDTRQILLQRDAQARATTRHQRATQARHASSSISGTPRGQAAPTKLGEGMTLRETIGAAMDQLSDSA